MAHWSGTRSGWNQRGAPLSLAERIEYHQQRAFAPIAKMLATIQEYLSEAEYDAWLESTPDDDPGFNKAVFEKFNQVQSP